MHDGLFNSAPCRAAVSKMPTTSELMACIVCPSEVVEVKALDMYAPLVHNKEPSNATVRSEAQKLARLSPGARALQVVRMCHRWPRLWEMVYKEERKLKKQLARQTPKHLKDTANGVPKQTAITMFFKKKNNTKATKTKKGATKSVNQTVGKA